MKRIWTTFFLGLLASVMTCGSVWAQATAQISGAAQDESSAVLPGVEVTATQTDTGISRMTVTNETGYYVLPNLPLGPYRLEAGLPGFRTVVRTGIVLQVNSNPTINLVLQVGQVSETVEVHANASLVETRSVSVGQVMETARKRTQCARAVAAQRRNRADCSRRRNEFPCRQIAALECRRPGHGRGDDPGRD
ncbi:MAG: hypothetical protein DMG13_15935 [Acidobacteria bacterium]|nr:MAG: hypothetical protein DMG13_15935 [Acidobacteriota bacterium]